MGCFSSKESKADNEVRKGLDKYAQQEAVERKLLLLGTGGSGKSTIFKNLKKVKGEQIRDQRTVSDTARTVRTNCATWMYTLLLKSEHLYTMDPAANEDCKVSTEDEEIVQCIKTVVQYGKDEFAEYTAEDLEELNPALTRLWQLPAIQATYTKRGRMFSFPDNMAYFYDKVSEIMRIDYEPSEEDIIKARVRTTGVVRYQYQKDDTIFHVVDVGGQRNERKKWIHQFDNVSAVIFVCALNHYNAVLFEDENVNAMHESVRVFTEISNKDVFASAEIILFLNKQDLFAEQIRMGQPLSVCFSEKAGWVDGEEWTGPDYVHNPDDDEETDDAKFREAQDAAIEFIQNLFVSKNEVEERVVFCHVTCATNANSVEKVFWDVQNIVIRANLKRGGLLV